MKHLRHICLTLVILATTAWGGHGLSAQTRQSGGTLAFTITDQSGAPVPGAAVMVEELSLWGISNDKGRCNISTEKNLIGLAWKISMMGYQTKEGKVKAEDLTKGIAVTILEENLSLKEVTVVAKGGVAGEATSSNIGRQALDHLQATSLKDVLQMIPGQVQMTNPSLIGAQSFSVRDLSSDSNSAFGSTVMKNGVALSRNASLPSSTSSLSGGNSGVDLRKLGTDDLESVEIIRGVASAEYGDMTSGLMIVNSRIGVSDLKVRGKIMPGIYQASAGKGFNLDKGNTLNFNLDFANGHSDPRYSTDIYDRFCASLAHRKVLGDGKWTLTSHFDATYSHEWQGPDPDEPEALQKYYAKSNEYSFLLSHEGKANLNLPCLGTLTYLLAMTYDDISSYKSGLVTVGGGSIFDSVADGMWEGKAYPMSYETVTGVKSKPLTLTAKVTDRFSANVGNVLKNNFNVGAEWKSEGNLGYGKWDDSPLYPDFAEGRLQRYCDIPFLNQASVFAEDKMELHFSGKDYPYLKFQMGVRGSMIQMGTDRQMGSISPRVNGSIEVCKWISLRGAYGLSHKMPSLLSLYPEKYYHDFYNQNVSDGKETVYHYTTNVFDRYNSALRPMQNEKIELGVDFRTPWGQSFSIVAFQETSGNAFASLDDRWVSVSYDRWYTMAFDKGNPGGRELIIYDVDIPGNGGTKLNRGLEYDFDLGKIKATNTSFYLSGAWSQTQSSSNNKYYKIPVGCGKSYSDVYVVYPEGTSSSKEQKRVTSTLRVVQHIPAIRFIVTATAQCIFYDYSFYDKPLTTPIGYIEADWQGSANGDVSGVKYHEFTAEELSSETATFGHGYLVKNQIFHVASSEVPTEWPAVWSMNMRATKEFGKRGGLSFYVNNFLFHQPWQRNTTAANEIERNGSFLSYGLELSFKF